MANIPPPKGKCLLPRKADAYDIAVHGCQSSSNYCYLFQIAALGIASAYAKTQKSPVIDNITDMKELKKLFRTKTNVLILFVAGMKDNNALLASFRDAAHAVKGQGTMVLLDCNNSEVKKICKKLKATPAPFALKHFKDGDFHKDYDRQLTTTSMVNFMRDPTGDLPWEEDPIGADVVHVPDAVVCLLPFRAAQAFQLHLFSFLF